MRNYLETYSIKLSKCFYISFKKARWGIRLCWSPHYVLLNGDHDFYRACGASRPLRRERERRPHCITVHIAELHTAALKIFQLISFQPYGLKNILTLGCLEQWDGSSTSALNWNLTWSRTRQEADCLADFLQRRVMSWRSSRVDEDIDVAHDVTKINVHF